MSHEGEIRAERSDAEVKQAVVEKFDWTPSVNGSRIGVAVTNGAVILSGQVDSYPERELAEHAALRVHGVNVVVEELTVASPWATVSDLDITQQASEGVGRAVDIPSEAAHTAAWSAPGVSSVVDHLCIAS